jgi:hypothetical protein
MVGERGFGAGVEVCRDRRVLICQIRVDPQWTDNPHDYEVIELSGRR